MEYKNKKMKFIFYGIFLFLILSSFSVNARLLQDVSSFVGDFFSSMPEAYQIKIILAFILFFILSAVINFTGFNQKSKTMFYFASLFFSVLLTVGIPDDFALLISQELGAVFGWIVLSLPLFFIILFFWAERSLKGSLGDDSRAENFLEVIFTLLTIVILNFTSTFVYNADETLNISFSNGILGTYGDILTILMVVYAVKLAFSIFSFFNHNVKFSETASTVGGVAKNVSKTVKNYKREKQLSEMEKKTIKELINLDLIEGKDIRVLKDIISKLESLIRYFSNPRVWDKVDAGALQVLSRKLRALETEGIKKAIDLVKDFKTEYSQNELLRKELLSLAHLDKMSSAKTRALFKSKFRNINNGKLSALQKKLNDFHKSLEKEFKRLKELDEEVKNLIDISEKIAVELENSLKQIASEVNLILSTLHHLNDEEKEAAARKLRNLVSSFENLKRKAEKLEQNRNELEIKYKEIEKIVNDEKMRILAEITLNNNIDDFLRHINEHVNMTM